MSGRLGRTGKIGTRRQSKVGRRGGEQWKAPIEPEYRPAFTDALPTGIGTIEEQFIEMARHDDEFIAWRASHERAAWATGR